MPSYTIDYCENCSENLSENRNERFLIYKIEFWDNSKYKAVKKNYLRDNACALMLCSKECIGEFLSKLIKGEV